jgi:phage FluMu protein Com
MTTVEDSRKRLQELGVAEKVIDEFLGSVNIGDIITHDEFSKDQETLPKDERVKDYRLRAIERLVKSKVAFRSNGNITSEMATFFLHPKCPYCKKTMKYDGGGGGSDSMTINFKCEKCKSELSLTVHNEDIVFRPKDTKEEG